MHLSSVRLVGSGGGNAFHCFGLCKSCISKSVCVEQR